MSRESVQFVEMARSAVSDRREGGRVEPVTAERVVLHCGLCGRLTVHRLMGWDFTWVIYQCTVPGCVGNREVHR